MCFYLYSRVLFECGCIRVSILLCFSHRTTRRFKATLQGKEGRDYTTSCSPVCQTARCTRGREATAVRIRTPRKALKSSKTRKKKLQPAHRGWPSPALIEQSRPSSEFDYPHFLVAMFDPSCFAKNREHAALEFSLKVAMNKKKKKNARDYTPTYLPR